MARMVPITAEYPGWTFVIQRTEGNVRDMHWVITKGETAAWDMLHALQDRQERIDAQRGGKNAYGELIADYPAWHNCFRMWAVLPDVDDFTHEMLGKAGRTAPDILLYGYSATRIMANRSLAQALDEVHKAGGCGILIESPGA